MSRPSSEGVEHYARRIARQVPGLAIRTIRANDAGWGSRVFEVNHQWIFRFPRTNEVRRGTEAALRFYPFLASIVPVEIPENVYQVRSHAGRLMFVGYRKLRGRSLPESGLHRAAADRWARDLAEVLRALSSVTPAHARRAGLPERSREESRRRRVQQYRRVRSSIWPRLSGEARRRDEAAWEDSLGDPGFRRVRPCLVHGDLYPSHILTERAGLTGVLDWEDSALGDPASDFAVLPTADGFAKKVWTLARDNDEELWHRSRTLRHWAFGANLEYWQTHRNPARVRSWTRRYVDSIP